MKKGAGKRSYPQKMWITLAFCGKNVSNFCTLEKKKKVPKIKKKVDNVDNNVESYAKSE